MASLCFALIGAVFWQEDVRYSLPTPRPHDMQQVPIGTVLPVAAWFRDAGVNPVPSGPVLLHFFNPACSCSRFNLEHLRTLVRRYAGQVRFLAVVQDTGDIGPGSSARERAAEPGESSLRQRVEELGLGMPIVSDHGGTIARQAGIYATPQAVLLDHASRIIYRGNYNRTRYCSDARTEYVRMAIDDLLASRALNLPETRAYGCALPAFSPLENPRSSQVRANGPAK
jgi:hypothetical protein